jgi:hypothetical protein
MANIIMIGGESGSGKSTSLEGLSMNPALRENTGVFNVASKRLPFRNNLAVINHADYATIFKSWQKSEKTGKWKKIYVVDDATYLLSFDSFNRARESGYQKYTDMAVAFQQLLTAARQTDEDTIVYFLMHPDTGEDGREKPKTIGRMLDEKLCVEGLFPIVLDCEVRTGEDGKPRHVFVCENDGRNLAKAPMEMFSAEAFDNDLAAVDDVIRDYWGMAKRGASAKKKEGKDA